MAEIFTADILVTVQIRDSGGGFVQKFQHKELVTGLPNHQGAGVFKVPGGSTDVPIPFGSTNKGHVIGLIFSRKATVRFDAGDTGVEVGPGVFLLQSSDDGISEVLISTDPGEEVCIETLVAGGD